jgi:hypothetical protein
LRDSPEENEILSFGASGRSDGGEATIVVVLLLPRNAISPAKQTTTLNLLVFYFFYKQPLNLLNYFIYFSLSKMRGESWSHRACQILCDPFSRLSPP